MSSSLRDSGDFCGLGLNLGFNPLRSVGRCLEGALTLSPRTDREKATA